MIWYSNIYNFMDQYSLGVHEQYIHQLFVLLDNSVYSLLCYILYTYLLHCEGIRQILALLPYEKKSFHLDMNPS